MLAAASVEVTLNIPRQYAPFYDQGQEGACVGFSETWAMSIRNRKRYDPRKLYHEAQLIDEWAETPPEEGTSVRAGFEVLRTRGHWRIYDDVTRPVELDEGIASYKWARSTADIRAAIAAGNPVVLGVNWYQEFGNPLEMPREGRGSQRIDYYIGARTFWGRVLGGHAICVVGWSDAKNSALLCNTWGTSYPFIVNMPEPALARLQREGGEAGVIVDRP
jgi:hypothetical protein